MKTDQKYLSSHNLGKVFLVLDVGSPPKKTHDSIILLLGIDLEKKFYLTGYHTKKANSWLEYGTDNYLCKNISAT